MRDKNTKLIIEIGKNFKAKNLSLVTAESCTGGGLAYEISKRPECSSILERGYVTYSNPAKETMLGVKTSTLQIRGAASKQVALEMALGALKNSQAHVSIAITGIAGSDIENTRENSKSQNGVVWVSCTGFFGHSVTKNIIVKGNRQLFIEATIHAALKILAEYSRIYK